MGYLGFRDRVLGLRVSGSGCGYNRGGGVGLERLWVQGLGFRV
jgi:hypothetical protein